MENAWFNVTEKRKAAGAQHPEERRLQDDWQMESGSEGSQVRVITKM